MTDLKRVSPHCRHSCGGFLNESLEGLFYLVSLGVAVLF